MVELVSYTDLPGAISCRRGCRRWGCRALEAGWLVLSLLAMVIEDTVSSQRWLRIEQVSMMKSPFQRVYCGLLSVE